VKLSSLERARALAGCSSAASREAGLWSAVETRAYPYLMHSCTADLLDLQVTDGVFRHEILTLNRLPKLTLPNQVICKLDQDHTIRDGKRGTTTGTQVTRSQNASDQTGDGNKNDGADANQVGRSRALT
jgi:hypothetical protein